MELQTKKILLSLILLFSLNVSASDKILYTPGDSATATNNISIDSGVIIKKGSRLRIIDNSKKTGVDKVTLVLEDRSTVVVDKKDFEKSVVIIRYTPPTPNEGSHGN